MSGFGFAMRHGFRGSWVIRALNFTLSRGRVVVAFKWTDRWAIAAVTSYFVYDAARQ